jgi:hypothetical protein
VRVGPAHIDHPAPLRHLSRCAALHPPPLL